MPVGSTYDFAGNFSGRGISLEFRYMVTENSSVGVRGSWHVFSSKEHTTATQGGVTLTSTQLRSINVFPAALVYDYYFKPIGKRKVVPYAGLGVGPYYAERVADVSFFYLQDDAWHFGITPELGVMIPFKTTVLTLNTRFNYLFESSTSEEGYFNFNVGLDL